MMRSNSFADFAFLKKLPGRKIIGKGNHDYWWGTMKKLNEFTKENGLSTINFLFNNAYEAENIAVCGTRGWICPGDRDFGKTDEAVYRREGLRLETALKQAQKETTRLSELGRRAVMVGFMHYPPMGNGNNDTVFTELFERYGVWQVFYGHLHGLHARETTQNAASNVQYHLISGDFIAFNPVLIRLGD